MIEFLSVDHDYVLERDIGIRIMITSRPAAPLGAPCVGPARGEAACCACLASDEAKRRTRSDGRGRAERRSDGQEKKVLRFKSLSQGEQQSDSLSAFPGKRNSDRRAISEFVSHSQHS